MHCIVTSSLANLQFHLTHFTQSLVTRCVATNVKKPCRGVEFFFSHQQWHDNNNEPNKWIRDYEKSKREEKP
jgi:hypothetical protein